MAQYIIQDVCSGYIWGDTRDFANGPNHYDTIADACRALDQDLGEHGREYEEVSRLDGDSGYAVYRVDINGSEAVTVVHDGQDKETIEAVMRDCDLVGYVQWRDQEAACYEAGLYAAAPEGGAA